jgi:uncharacterized protein YidB (DUF937 family)
MKKLFWMFVLLGLLFAACTPQAEPTQESVLPVDDAPHPQPTPIPTQSVDAQSSAQRAAISALSKLTGLTADKITLISSEAVTWSDSCLGVQRAGLMCSQVLVEGFNIVLEAAGKEYEFHTNQNGSTVVLATGGGTAASAIEEALVEQLAQNLGLNPQDISVVSSDETEFGDACLGVEMPEVMCAQVVTPGMIVILEANGIQYEYHASEDGSRIQPATQAAAWKREGGIAGFCDNMIVFLSGEVYVSDCKGGGGMGTLTGLLSAGEREQFNTWLSDLDQIELDASDPEGVSDRMVVTLNVYGRGSEQPSQQEEDAMLQWAQTLFQKMGTQ